MARARITSGSPRLPLGISTDAVYVVLPIDSAPADIQSPSHEGPGGQAPLEASNASSSVSAVSSSETSKTRAACEGSRGQHLDSRSRTTKPRPAAQGKDWYLEQLKRPEWRLKRLEILERAKFHCEGCGQFGEWFDIHHKHYVSGRNIWEYEANELQALCRSCHELVTHGKPLPDELVQLVGKVAERLLIRFDPPKPSTNFDADRTWRWIEKFPDRRVHRPLMKFAAWLYATGARDMGVLLSSLEDRCRRNPENAYAYYAAGGIARDCKSARFNAAESEAEGLAYKAADLLFLRQAARLGAKPVAQ